MSFSVAKWRSQVENVHFTLSESTTAGMARALLGNLVACSATVSHRAISNLQYDWLSVSKDCCSRIVAAMRVVLWASVVMARTVRRRVVGDERRPQPRLE